MKEKFQKFKKWLFRPVSPKVKTGGIIFPLATLVTYSIVLSLFTHWLLALVPVALLLIVLYTAKLPVEVDKKTILKAVKKNDKK